MIPDKFPFKKFAERGAWGNMTEFAEQWRIREEWASRGMYAFVSQEWVKPLSEWIGERKVLEVMAGAGWLSLALRLNGTDIIATDDYSWHRKFNFSTVTAVVELDAINACEKFGQDCDLLIISWPYMDNHAYDCITKYHTFNPKGLILYVGEPEGGCTASLAFFEHFEEVEDDAFETIKSQYRTWDGLNDRLWLGRYKP